MKLLFVCTGNTCRSPMAAGYLRKLCAENSIEGVTVESAGLAAGNAPASLNAQKAAARSGFDLSSHRSRQLTKEIADSADMIFAMTPAHRQQIEVSFPECASKVRLLMNGAGVPDPFGGDEAEYEACLEKMKEPVRQIFLEYIKTNQ